MRARRQDMIEKMAIKARQMEHQNMQLANHASTVEQQHAAMMAQLGEFNQRLQQTTVENEQLAKEISCLRNAVNNVRFSASALAVPVLGSSALLFSLPPLLARSATLQLLQRGRKVLTTCDIVADLHGACSAAQGHW